MVKYIISAVAGAAVASIGFVSTSYIKKFDRDVITEKYASVIAEELPKISDTEVLREILSIYNSIDSHTSNKKYEESMEKIIELIQKGGAENAPIVSCSSDCKIDHEADESCNIGNSKSETDRVVSGSESSEKVTKTTEEEVPDEAMKLAKDLANKFAKKGSRSILVQQLYNIFNENILTNPAVLSEFAALVLDGDKYEQSNTLNDLMDKYEVKGDDNND